MKQFRQVVALALLTLWVVALSFGGNAKGSGVSTGNVAGIRPMLSAGGEEQSEAIRMTSKIRIDRTTAVATARPVALKKADLPAELQGVTAFPSVLHIPSGFYTSIGIAVGVLDAVGPPVGGTEIILDNAAYTEDALIFDASSWGGANGQPISIHPNTGVSTTISFRTTATEGKGFSFTAGTKNVTIDGTAGGGLGLTLNYAAGYPFPAGDALAATIYVTGACDGITVKHATINGNIQGTFAAQTDGRSAVFCFRGAGDVDPNSNITIDNCTIINATFGLKVLCEDGNGDYIDQGPITFTHNNMGAAYGGPVLLGCFTEFATTFDYGFNNIDGVQYNNKYWYDGPTEWDIDWVFAGAPRSFLYNFGQYSAGHIYYSGGATVHDNYIRNVSAVGNNGDGGILMYGMVVRLALSGTLKAWNNRIELITNDDLAGQVNGIRASSLNAYHNTVKLSGSANNAVSQCWNGDNSIRNNIFQNTNTPATTSNARCLAGTVATSNWNSMYASPGRIYPTSASLNTYLATGKDPNSVFGDPNLDGTLHIASASTAENIGTTIAVPVDIDGDARAATPDAGADELVAVGAPVAIDILPTVIPVPLAGGVPAGLPVTPTVTVKNNSNQAVGAFTVAITITDGYVGSAASAGLPAGGSATLTASPAWTPGGTSWTISATTSLSDANNANNTISRAQTVQPPFAVPAGPTGKTWDWNASDDGWTRSVDWVRSNSFTKLGGPYAGYSMVTNRPNLTSTYTEGQNASTQGYAANYPGANILFSPWLNLTALTSNVYVSQLQSLNTEPGWDDSWIDYTVDGTNWYRLGKLNDPNGVNWYNESVYENAKIIDWENVHGGALGNPPDTATMITYGIISAPAQPKLADWPNWTSNGAPNGADVPTGPNGYVFQQLHITPGQYTPEIVGAPLVKFRLVAFSDAGGAFEGWAVDNFRVADNGASFSGNTLDGTVYHDVNGNGTNDAEPADAGIKVYLSYFGVPKDSAVTNGAGGFSFNTALDNGGLPGIYNLRAAKAGYSIIGHLSGIVDVNADGSGSTVTTNIGTFLGSVSGVKWADDNKDGVKDGGETHTYAGFVIELHRDSCNGALLGTATTDGSGNYSFGVGPGTYYLKEVPQAGYDQTFPLGNCSGAVTVAQPSGGGGAVVTGVNFGNYKHGQITVNKYVDLNGNGVQDGGDVTAMPVGATAIIHIVGPGLDKYDTLGNNVGSAVHGGLQNGSYTATEVFTSPDWVRTLGAGGINVVINTSGQNSSATFMNFKMPSACGHKFEDKNGNGVQDGGEPGLAGWKINISGTVYGSSSAVTDVNGDWCIDSLGGGAHVISEVVQSGWTQTKPVGGTYSFNGQSANVPGANQTGKDFGNFKNICISGTKYRDRDNDGTQDAGEEGLAGWQINVDGTGAANTTTAGDGTWQICDVGPGNHVVTETPQVGWAQTQPVGPGYTISPATSGVDVSGLDFGNFQVTDGSYKYRTFSSDDIEQGAQEKAQSRPKVKKPTIPNLRNVVKDFFAKGQNLVVTVGIPNVIKNGPPFIQITKEGDFLKSLWDKGVTHSTEVDSTEVYRGLDFKNGGAKPLLGKQKSLSPKVQKNDCAEELIVLAFNLAMSNAAKIPTGLGSLVYNDGLAEPDPAYCAGFPLNGKSIAQIKAIGDNLMTNYVGVPKACYARLEQVAANINSAFSCGNLGGGNVDCETFYEPAIDSAIWWGNLKLFTKGRFPVSDFPFLKATGAEPTTVVITPDPITVPDVYSLYQNYPNPFNPTTSIDFDLPEDAIVTLKIYNVLGQEVATLLNHEQYTSGAQTMEFDASSLPSGVYIYRLVAEGMDDDGNVTGKAFTQTKKMLLMK